MNFIPKKGDLVYLPSNITLIDCPVAKEFIRLEEPRMAVILEPNWNGETIYHRVHLGGSSWLARTIDTLEVVSSA